MKIRCVTLILFALPLLASCNPPPTETGPGEPPTPQASELSQAVEAPLDAARQAADQSAQSQDQTKAVLEAM